MRKYYDKYQLNRKIKPCIVDKALQGYKLTKYLANEKTTQNKHLNIELFDEVLFMKKTGEVIQAIGMIGTSVTVLIFEKQ